jgi:hypothetical protein
VLLAVEDGTHGLGVVLFNAPLESQPIDDAQPVPARAPVGGTNPGEALRGPVRDLQLVA